MCGMVVFRRGIIYLHFHVDRVRMRDGRPIEFGDLHQNGLPRVVRGGRGVKRDGRGKGALFFKAGQRVPGRRRGREMPQVELPGVGGHQSFPGGPTRTLATDTWTCVREREGEREGERGGGAYLGRRHAVLVAGDRHLHRGRQLARHRRDAHLGSHRRACVAAGVGVGVCVSVCVCVGSGFTRGGVGVAAQ